MGKLPLIMTSSVTCLDIEPNSRIQTPGQGSCHDLICVTIVTDLHGSCELRVIHANK